MGNMAKVSQFPITSLLAISSYPPPCSAHTNFLLYANNAILLCATFISLNFSFSPIVSLLAINLFSSSTVTYCPLFDIIAIFFSSNILFASCGTTYNN